MYNRGPEGLYGAGGMELDKKVRTLEEENVKLKFEVSTYIY